MNSLLCRACAILTVALLVTMLLGCGSTQVRTEVKEKIKIDCGAIPVTDRVTMMPVKPFVIQDKADIFWVGITPQDYGNLAVNWKNVLSALKQKNAVIVFYEDCIDFFNRNSGQSESGIGEK